MIYDYCIIGGGIVGLASAMKILEQRPGSSLILVDKEAGPGRHQTGHNSGVIHAGIYYAPGSLKAKLCRQGARATKDFCAEHNIPFETCGKLLVATNEQELTRLEGLVERARLNEIQVLRLSGGELKEREPNITGIAALFVPETGIVDYRKVCERMVEVIRNAGAAVEFSARVTAISEASDHVTVVTEKGNWQARKLVACAGLQSDRIARTAGIPADHRIIPFRGEYFVLPPSKNKIVKHLIYPFPDPSLPFLGVHLTRMIDGSVTVGPNAVLGFAREGYPKFSFNAADVADCISFPGFWKTMRKHIGHGIKEMRNSIFTTGYLNECRKYCPSLELSDLSPYEAGIRAQAVRRDGSLVEDFLFLETPRMLHVCNAPSPAATSAIPIGEMIASRIIGASC